MSLRKYLLIAALVLSSQAHAEIPLKNYKQFRDDPAVKDRLANYVIGIYQGIF